MRLLMSIAFVLLSSIIVFGQTNKGGISGTIMTLMEPRFLARR